MIKDHDDLSCTVETKDIKNNISNIESDGKGRIRIYLNKEVLNKDIFVIKRFGKKAFDSDKVYYLVPSSEEKGLYRFRK